MAHLQRSRHVAGLAHRGHGFFHRCRGAADHRLFRAVEVGNHHVAGDGAENFFDFGNGAKDRSHHAVVSERGFGHFTAARRHRLQGFLERQSAGRHQRAVFAQAVAHHHVRCHTISAQQARQRGFCGEHGRLRDGSLLQVFFGGCCGRFIAFIQKNVIAQAFAAKQRLHDAIGLGKSPGDDRLGGAQRCQHVEIL